MNARITLGLKTMGFDVKEISRKDLAIQIKAEWTRTGDTFAFFYYDKFLDLEETVQFKNTVEHCSVNDIKYIVFSSKAKDIIERENYRILPVNKVKDLMKDYTIALAS